MKKFKLICLSLLLCFCGIAFSACTKAKVDAQDIHLSDYFEETPSFNLLTNQKKSFGVTIEPANVDDKTFEASVVDPSKAKFLSFDYDEQGMSLTIIATGTIPEENVNVPVKLQCMAYPDIATNFVVRIYSNASELTALKSPELSFDNSKNVVWNDVDGATKYKVEVFAEEQLVASDFVQGATTYALPQAKLAGKKTVVKVQAKGKTPDLDSEFSVLSFSVLPSPTNVEYDVASEQLTWNAVQNATGYEVTIGSKIAFSATNAFDATGYFDVAGANNIVVRAVGTNDNTYLSSTYSQAYKVTKLDSVKNLKLAGDTLIWNAVDGASSYQIQISNGTKTVAKTNTSESFVDLSAESLDSGKYTVSVVALGANKNVIAGDSRQFDFSKLAKPTGFKVENGIIKWNSSTNGYKIYLNSVVYDDYRKNTTFDATTIKDGISNFNIVARGNGTNTISSDPLFDAQNPLRVYKLLPAQLSLNGQGQLSWSQIGNASKYVITLGGSVELEKSITEFDTSILNSAIDYSTPISVEFTAKGDTFATFDGGVWKDANGQTLLDKNGDARTTLYLDADTQKVQVQKLNTINLQYGTENQQQAVIWSGANQGGYTVFVESNGEQTTSETIHQNYYATSNFCLDESLTAPKVYSVSVIARALTNTNLGENWYIDSDISNTVEVTKLPNASISVANGQVVWTYGYIDNISNYTLQLTNKSDNSQKTEVLGTSQTSYDFADQGAGEYTFGLIANAKANTNYVSSTIATIDVTKLANLSSVNISKTSHTTFASPYDTYAISFDDPNGGNAQYVCTRGTESVTMANSQGKYSFSLTSAQIAGNLKFSIQVLGNSTKYLNGSTFEFSVQKSNFPSVYINDAGTKVKCDAKNYCMIFASEKVLSGTSNDEVSVQNGDKFVTKTVAMTKNETAITNGQEVLLDSQYSQIYTISKLAKPKFFVKNGVLQVESMDAGTDTSSYKLHLLVGNTDTLIENRNFSNLNSSIKENDVTYSVSGYFTDSNSGEVNDGMLYLQSDTSSTLKVKKLPKPENLSMKNGMLYITFEEGKIVENGRIAVFCNDRDVASETNTSLTYNFAEEQTTAGTYRLKAQAQSTMGGSSGDTVYCLHGDISDEISVTKLAKVDSFEVTAFAPKENGTVLNMASTIQGASNALPNSMPTQSGSIRWRQIQSATQYLITNTSTNETMIVKANAQSDGYIYVNLQNTIFVAGKSTITIKAIGNQKEIVDSEVSGDYSFTKLIEPQNLAVSGDGKITWKDTNKPNNSNLGTIFGYPTWLLSKSDNAYLYIVKINNKYYTYIDLTTLMDDLKGLTKKVQNLSYQLSLSSSDVSTVQVCAMPLNSYVNESTRTVMSDSGNYMSWKVAQTDNVYVDSDFSNEIYIKSALAPYGLTINQNAGGDEILSWTNPYSQNASAQSDLTSKGYKVKGYQIEIKAYDKDSDGKLVLRRKSDAEGEDGYEYTDRIDVSGANTTSWNFSSYLDGLDSNSNRFGTYSFVVKTVVETVSTATTSTVAYIDSAWSLSYDTNVLKTPELGLRQGQIAWYSVSNAISYTIVVNGKTISISANEVDDDGYLSYASTMDKIKDGDNIVTITAIGDGKKVISSSTSSVVNYYKLPKVTAELDTTTGLVKYTPIDLGSDSLNSQWNYYITVNSDAEVSNTHNTSFDLSGDGNTYDGGKLYDVSVEAKNATLDDTFVVYASDSDKKYIINSGKSNVVTAYKLKTPSIFGVDQNQQSINWTNQDTSLAEPGNISYILDIAGAESVLKANAYSFENEGEVNAVVSVRTIYSGNVTIDGKSYSCIRSDKNEKVNIQKLNAPTNISMVNGILHYENITGVETKLVYGQTISTFESKTLENGQYDFFDIKDTNTYFAHLYSSISQDKLGRVTETTDSGKNVTIYLSSKSTETFKFQKLPKPTELDFEKTFDGQKLSYNLMFAKVDNATQYQVKYIQIDQTGNDISQTILDSKTYATVVASPTKLDVTADFEGENVGEMKNAQKFALSVVLFGSNATSIEENEQYYVLSDSNKITMTRIEAVKDISLVKDNDIFTGRSEWSKPTDSDGKTISADVKYNLYVTDNDELDTQSYAYLNDGAVKEAEGAKTKTYSLDTTHCQFAYNGGYTFYVVVVPQNATTLQDAKTGEYTKLYESLASQSETVEYRLFGDGEGIKDSPYKVENYLQFNRIRYNLNAYYKLSDDINYSSGGSAERLTTIPNFNGTIDGDGHIVFGFATSNFAGIVGTLEEKGTIKNLILGNGQATIKSIATTVGGFASTNNGTIESCINKLNIQMSSSATNVYAVGGIAGINNGTISKCGNTGNLYGNIVGGICAKMLGGTVSECYNGSGESYAISALTRKLTLDHFGGYYGFVGGIVAYATGGSVENSYANSTVCGDNSSNGTVYVGGIAGYAKNVTISCCYAVSKAGTGNNRDMIDSEISSNSHVGILVGQLDGDASSTFTSCVSIYTDEQQALSYAVGNMTLTKGGTVNGYDSNSASIYSNVYKVVSNNGTSGKFVSSGNAYPTLANARY